MRKEFAALANEFYVWVTQLKTELLQDLSGDLNEQLEALKMKEDSINQDTHLQELEVTNKRLEDAHIDENPYTEYTFDELALLHEQMKNVLKKKKQFLEDQLAAKTSSNITPEKLEEFKQTFHHFDKDGSGFLDKLEFRACLQSLGKNFTV